MVLHVDVSRMWINCIYIDVPKIIDEWHFMLICLICECKALHVDAPKMFGEWHFMLMCLKCFMNNISCRCV